MSGRHFKKVAVTVEGVDLVLQGVQRHFLPGVDLLMEKLLVPLGLTEVSEGLYQSQGEQVLVQTMISLKLDTFRF